MLSQTIVALLACVASVNAVSSGAVDICNALSTLYGCTNFKDGLRSQCEEDGRIMQWVTKPVVNDKIVLWAGEDESNPVLEYTPGEWMEVNLRVKEYDMQYRGLLMYAIDASQEPTNYPNHFSVAPADLKNADPTKIGKWEFTDRQDMFHSYCPRTVLHASGELKPYHTSWRFLPPADFTGDIQFVALIKTGPANKGEFWYPNKVVLKRAAAKPTPAGERWYKGKLNESCQEVCSNLEMTCDASRMKSVSSAADLTSKVLPFTTCNKPPLLRCGNLGLSQGADGFCYYPNAALCDTYKLPKFPEGEATCTTKSDDEQVGHRLCPCACDGNKGPCFVPPPTTTTTAKPPPKATPAPPPVKPPTKPNGEPRKCTGAAGDCCLADGTCTAAKTECRSGTCVKKTVCVYGDAGCPCTLEKSNCVRGLTCSNGVCAASEASTPADFCANRIGLAGCWCTPPGGCIEANLVPTQNADGKCFCKVIIPQSGGANGALDDVCARGDLGCPCQAQRCKAGGVCELVGQRTICRSFKEDGTDVDDSSAASLVASASLIVAAVVALLF